MPLKYADMYEKLEDEFNRPDFKEVIIYERENGWPSLMYIRLDMTLLLSDRDLLMKCKRKKISPTQVLFTWKSTERDCHPPNDDCVRINIFQIVLYE
jgi:hypothetical protein